MYNLKTLNDVKDHYIQRNVIEQYYYQLEAEHLESLSMDEFDSSIKNTLRWLEKNAPDVIFDDYGRLVNTRRAIDATDDDMDTMLAVNNKTIREAIVEFALSDVYDVMEFIVYDTFGIYIDDNGKIKFSHKQLANVTGDARQNAVNELLNRLSVYKSDKKAITKAVDEIRKWFTYEAPKYPKKKTLSYIINKYIDKIHRDRNIRTNNIVDNDEDFVEFVREHDIIFDYNWHYINNDVNIDETIPIYKNIVKVVAELSDELKHYPFTQNISINIMSYISDSDGYDDIINIVYYPASLLESGDITIVINYDALNPEAYTYDQIKHIMEDIVYLHAIYEAILIMSRRHPDFKALIEKNNINLEPVDKNNPISKETIKKIVSIPETGTFADKIQTNVLSKLRQVINALSCAD